MLLTLFIDKIRHNEKVSFQDTIAVITEHYHYQPTEFSNGIGQSKLINAAGTNEGSCKLFYFAQIQHLNQSETLRLFGDYYWQDVLQHPDGTDHQNIRNFMRYGWEGVIFSGEALVAK